MDTQTIFYLQLFSMLILYILIARWYVLPALYRRSLHSALTPLLLFSVTRVMGLFFILPQMTNSLPTEFAQPAAWGDFSVGILALVAAIAVHARLKAGIGLAWAYGILGALDFIYALYLGNMYNMPLHLGPSWFTITMIGPAMMVTVALILIVLVKHAKQAQHALQAESI